jgi:hypothetical protein
LYHGRLKALARRVRDPPSTREGLSSISRSWRRWAEQEDGFFVVLHAELIARRE